MEDYALKGLRSDSLHSTFLDGQHGGFWNMAVATKQTFTTSQGAVGIPVNRVLSAPLANQYIMADLVELYVIHFNW